MKTHLAPSYLICGFSSLLASLPAVLQSYPWLLFINYGPDMRKIRYESLGDVTNHWMEQGLSDGTGYINCSLACRKFTCQLHFNNTCTSSDLFRKLVNICSGNLCTFSRLIYLILIPLHKNNL